MFGSIETYWNYIDTWANSAEVSPKHHGISHSWSTTDRYPMLRVGVSGSKPWPSLTPHEFWKCCAYPWNGQGLTTEVGGPAECQAEGTINTSQHMLTLQTQCIELIDPLQEAGKVWKLPQWQGDIALCAVLGVRPVLVPSLSFAPQPRSAINPFHDAVRIHMIHECVCVRICSMCLFAVVEQNGDWSGWGSFSFGAFLLTSQAESLEQTANRVQCGGQAFKLRLRMTEIFCRVSTMSERSPSVNVLSVPCAFLQVGEFLYAVEVSCMDLMRLPETAKFSSSKYTMKLAICRNSTIYVVLL